MKRRQLESLLSALVPTLRHFIERQIEGAATQLRTMIAELPKPKDGDPGKSVTIEDVTPLVSGIVDREVSKAADAVKAALPAVPTLEQVVEELRPHLPKATDVATIVVAGIDLPKVPTAEEVAKLVIVPEMPAVPTAEDVAKLVQLPAVPTLEEIVGRVMTKLPTAKEIADLVPTPTVELKEAPEVPTVEQIIEQITPKLPSAKSIADEVRASITVPSAAEIAEQAAKLVVLPEIEIPQLPELPHVPTTKEIVDELLKQLPAPEKGDKGDPGQSVDVSAIEQMIERQVESRVAKWALEWERRADDRLQKYLDGIAKPKDGVDGFGFDDMQLDFDGERHVTVRFERAGKPTKEFSFDLPNVIYRGVWKAGEYTRGDSVTWDGCTWIAKRATTEKPGPGSDDWQLAVKKGRDGRDPSPSENTPTQVRVAPRK